MFGYDFGGSRVILEDVELILSCILQKHTQNLNKHFFEYSNFNVISFVDSIF